MILLNVEICVDGNADKHQKREAALFALPFMTVHQYWRGILFCNQFC